MSHIKGNDTQKDILILNMSIMYNTNLNYYFYQDKQGHYLFSGISQLEPGTKYVVEMLAQQDRKLDQIIITASAEAREKKVTFEGEELPALKIYKKRILDYVSGKENAAISDTENVLRGVCLNNPAKITEIYQDLKEDIFNVINLESDHSELLLLKRKIQQISDDESINIYVDMQGGSRGFIYVLNSVLEMLRGNDKVHVKKRYAVDYDRTRKLNPIVEENLNYASSDLMAGMKAFTTYGKADLLLQYLDKIKVYRNNPAEEKLIEIIRMISDAIQICMTDEFEKGIQMLREFYSSEKVYSDKVFEIISDDIRDSYGELLNTDHTVIDSIEWCCKKGFIQQALTLYVENLPSIYYNKTVKETGKRGLLKQFEAGAAKNPGVSEAANQFYEVFFEKLEEPRAVAEFKEQLKQVTVTDKKNHMAIDYGTMDIKYKKRLHQLIRDNYILNGDKRGKRYSQNNYNKDLRGFLENMASPTYKNLQWQIATGEAYPKNASTGEKKIRAIEQVGECKNLEQLTTCKKLTALDIQNMMTYYQAIKNFRNQINHASPDKSRITDKEKEFFKKCGIQLELTSENIKKVLLEAVEFHKKKILVYFE